MARRRRRRLSELAVYIACTQDICPRDFCHPPKRYHYPTRHYCRVSSRRWRERDCRRLETVADSNFRQEAQLSPRDRAMRRVS